MQPKKRKKTKSRDILMGMKRGPHEKSRQYIARRMKELRISLGLSQEDFARKAGMHRSYQGFIENCKVGISIDTIGKILEAYDVELDDFFSNKKF